LTGGWRFVCCFAIGASLLEAGQARTELPPVSRIPIEERLWTAEIGNGRSEAYPGESDDLERACGDARHVTGLTVDVWHACRARHIKAARYRIATLHAAPSASSAVVASLYEERRVVSGGGLEFEWTVEPTSNPAKRLVWPEAGEAFDYGLHVAGVQRRGNWVRLLTSIPADGWLPITDPDEPGTMPIYIRVSSLADQIVEVSALTASWPDGSRRQIAEGSYLVQRVSGGFIAFRAEIPSDFACGDPVTDPVPLPPTLSARASEFFNPNGTPRFSTKYTKGC
jgi:hypothetical protein